jgi:acyl carrier protein phosphodiesterase
LLTRFLTQNHPRRLQQLNILLMAEKQLKRAKVMRFVLEVDRLNSIRQQQQKLKLSAQQTTKLNLSIVLT